MRSCQGSLDLHSTFNFDQEGSAHSLLRITTRLTVLFFILFVALFLAGVARGEDLLFQVRTHTVSGRPVQVVAADLRPDLRMDAKSRGNGLIVVTVSDSPPLEKRQLVLFPAGSPAPVTPITIDLPPDIVAFDVGNIDESPGDEIVLIAASKLTILHPFLKQETREIAVKPPLPLPPRTHGLSRLAVLGDWTGHGVIEALVPTLNGAALIPLQSEKNGTRTDLPLPMQAEYWTTDRRTRAPAGFFGSTVTWPTITQADNNGDQRLDLFGLSRFGVWIYHATDTGLASEPTHRFGLRLFSATEQLRPRATAVRLFARDLDADGLADLVVHRTAGSMLKSRAATDIYRNQGTGIDLSAGPQLTLTTDDAFATIELVDLDGNGRTEILQAQFAFGIFQAIRILTTRRAAVDLRIFTLPEASHTQAEISWQGDVTLRLDFSQGRAEGLLPTAEGDWNGDGRRDLLYGLNREELAIHLGTAGKNGPGFSSSETTQTVPAASDSLVLDRNSDGLDDLVLFDPRDDTGAIHILVNRGQLPGTPVSLRVSVP